MTIHSTSFYSFLCPYEISIYFFMEDILAFNCKYFWATLVWHNDSSHHSKDIWDFYLVKKRQLTKLIIGYLVVLSDTLVIHKNIPEACFSIPSLGVDTFYVLCYIDHKCLLGALMNIWKQIYCTYQNRSILTPYWQDETNALAWKSNFKRWKFYLCGSQVLHLRNFVSYLFRHHLLLQSFL